MGAEQKAVMDKRSASSCALLRCDCPAFPAGSSSPRCPTSTPRSVSRGVGGMGGLLLWLQEVFVVSPPLGQRPANLLSVQTSRVGVS